MSLSRYFHTIRHLRPIQLYGRIWSRLHTPRVDGSPPPDTRSTENRWAIHTARAPSLTGPSRLRFLNLEMDAADASAWNNPDIDKLWLYNLHYFEDLNAKGAEARGDWHRELLARWVAENPPGTGVGWDPYPMSLRMVNWIKWSLSGNELGADLLYSLAIQARYLRKRIEYWLLGNHLLANGKALLIAGYFFEGSEADEWRRTGERILGEELRKQILPDGGHFERSPLYHSIILEDLLDCVNVMNAFGDTGRPLRAKLVARAEAMLGFLRDILHPDGEIPFFNDAAIGIALPPRDLLAYAEKLDLRTPDPDPGRVVRKERFGLWVFRGKESAMIIDAGPIGPDYLTGHAHCDTLSYEMSIGSQRFIVNSGTYTYSGPDRHLFRATAAHNTVRIDGEEQHEIWASFRVARRGYPRRVEVRIDELGDAVRFSGAHTGYQRLRGRPVHHRTVARSGGTWRIEDTIDGAGVHKAESFIHLHPDVVITKTEAGSIQCRYAGFNVAIQSTEDEVLGVEDGYYSPEFGKKQANKTLLIRKTARAPFTIEYRIVIEPA